MSGTSELTLDDRYVPDKVLMGVIADVDVLIEVCQCAFQGDFVDFSKKGCITVSPCLEHLDQILARGVNGVDRQVLNIGFQTELDEELR